MVIPFAVKSLKKKPLLLESFNKSPSVSPVETEKIVSILFITPSLKIFIKKSGAKKNPTEVANVAKGDFVKLDMRIVVPMIKSIPTNWNKIRRINNSNKVHPYRKLQNVMSYINPIQVHLNAGICSTPSKIPSKDRQNNCMNY